MVWLTVGPQRTDTTTLIPFLESLSGRPGKLFSYKEEGCGLRMNRSIQAEGSFGELKQDSGFRRFLCSGNRNVKAEAVLLSIAYNVEKLHHKLQSERTGTHLFPLKKAHKF